jgi:CRISPR-associated protein Cas2
VFVILVYDTLAERNPQALKTCRKYLHWVQRSVFEGELSSAQYMSLTKELTTQLDTSYDSVRIYTVRTSDFIDKHTIGTASPTQAQSSSPAAYSCDLRRCTTGGLPQTTPTFNPLHIL